MLRSLSKVAVATVIALGSAGGVAAHNHMERTVEVGGAPMYPSKTIVANAVNSKDHTTLVAAVRPPVWSTP